MTKGEPPKRNVDCLERYAVKEAVQADGMPGAERFVAGLNPWRRDSG